MMQNNALIDALPLWALFILIMLIVLLSVEFGYRLGKYRRSHHEMEKEAPLGTLVGATLGLLAFILAFTFGLAASRFDNRKQLLLDEANAIGTTYLRAGLLPERGQQVRDLLRDYVAARLEAVQPSKLAQGIRQSEDIQKKVWSEAEALGQKNDGWPFRSIAQSDDRPPRGATASGSKESNSRCNLVGPFCRRGSLSCDHGLPRRP
jgi:hypothetical protein